MLPKIEAPILSVSIPSTSKTSRFRPFRRSEEKILLIARESDDPLAWVEAVHQVVSNCSLDVDVDDMTGFDLEYAFVKLRAASIGNKETVAYRDSNDGMLYEVEIDFDKVVVAHPPVVDDVVKINDTARLKLRWPSARAWSDPEVIRAANAEDALDALVAHCIDRVWVGDESYDPATSQKDEVAEFLNELDVSAWRQIREWASATPHLSYWVEWTNSMGEQRRFELKTLTDFFTFSSRVDD